jgi:hypothetical protein
MVAFKADYFTGVTVTINWMFESTARNVISMQLAP